MLDIAKRPEIIAHSRLLADSYAYWTGQTFFPEIQDDARLAIALYEAPFVVVSHGTESDPIFNYANRCAQSLWKLSWEQFTTLPSRKSAEPIAESRRQELMEHAKKQGVITNYQGIRIASDGKRFQVIDLILYNILDKSGQYYGQAAKFDRWKLID